MGTINTFLSNIQEVARPKLFDVNIIIPTALNDYFNLKNKGLVGFEESLTYRCESTNIPGRTFATTEQKFGSNPSEKHAYHTTYNDVDMTFIVTENSTINRLTGKIENSALPEKQLFDEWMNIINPTETYDFAYKTDYVAPNIEIRELDSAGNLLYGVKLIDAFPISVNQLDLDWSNDGYHKLSVTFAYTRWEKSF